MNTQSAFPTVELTAPEFAAPGVETAAVRALEAARVGAWDATIAAAATALALGADQLPAHPAPSRSHALGQLAEALSILGVHEHADRVARTAIAAAHGSAARTAARLRLIRARITGAFHDELDGNHAAAISGFAQARFAATQNHRRHDRDFTRTDRTRGDRTATALATAAVALHRPDPAHLPMLTVTPPLTAADDAAIVAIAAWRCLPSNGHADSHDDGAGRRISALLAPDIAQVRQPVLRIALRRAMANHRPRTPRSTNTAGPANPNPRSPAALKTALEVEVLDRCGALATALRYALAYHRLRLAHDDAVHHALHDPLTGLPNRRAADQHLHALAAPQPGEPPALAMIDLDRFKTVNDRYSHTVGDTVLRAVSGCLRRALREHDLLARVGGDEFLAVLPATSQAHAATTLRRAADAVAALPAVRGVTVSVGLSDLPPGTDPAASLARADTAMYEAKWAGGSRVVIAADTRSASVGPLISPLQRTEHSP